MTRTLGARGSQGSSLWEAQRRWDAIPDDRTYEACLRYLEYLGRFKGWEAMGIHDMALRIGCVKYDGLAARELQQLFFYKLGKGRIC